MKVTKEPPPWQYVSAWSNKKKFYCLQPMRTFKVAIPEVNATVFLLDANVSNAELGAAVLAALGESTFLSPRGFPSIEAFQDAFYDGRKQNELDPAPWIAPAMERYGYTSERSLMRQIWNLGIRRKEGEIEMTPHHKSARGGWGVGPTGRDISERTPDGTDPERIGVLFRRCLDKCTA